jgi:hypothetical protein
MKTNAPGQTLCADRRPLAPLTGRPARVGPVSLVGATHTAAGVALRAKQKLVETGHSR